ncbi:hypothetical protein EHI8A_216130 [Entamoeba histolytica HM-1:IMSS-B]|nr:Hypothetical protein EHI5A_165540 [Entamoeba histolytica KU27]EMH75331.1 hypothetical protein EHI8A_216130 [Entamoeba histolytica HM-1:IMSS-B]ENY61697.1 hypothetical protein EHI7A_112720 [Entamoeba histolytica HM-1:IMSS-A]
MSSISENSIETQLTNKQTEAQQNTVITNYIQFFSRLFIIKRVVKEDDLTQLIQTHFTSLSISSIIRELNQSFQALHMEIRRSINQNTGDYVYVLITTNLDEINQVACIFDQNDLKKVNELIELLINNNYKIQRNSLDDEYDSVCNILIELNYLNEISGILTFGPCYLVSEEASELQLPHCEICNLPGTIGTFCPNSTCQTFYHLLCLKRLGRENHLCSRCKTHLDYN